MKMKTIELTDYQLTLGIAAHASAIHTRAKHYLTPDDYTESIEAMEGATEWLRQNPDHPKNEEMVVESLKAMREMRRALKAK
jgi:hypothetical protein